MRIWFFHSGFGICLCKSELVISLYPITFFFPFSSKSHDVLLEAWIGDNGLTFSLGRLRSRFDTPWTWKYWRKELLSSNGKVLLTDYIGDINIFPSDEKKAALPFTIHYAVNGKLRRNEGIFYYLTRSWRMKWFPFIRKTKIVMHYEFNEEFGSKAGTYDGGEVMGTHEVTDFVHNHNLIDAMHHLCVKDGCKLMSVTSCSN